MSGLLTIPPPYAEKALCADLGPDDRLWFPDARTASAIKLAKSLCAACPVRWECLETALELGPRCAGIWGGMTERQRRKMRKHRRVQQLSA